VSPFRKSRTEEKGALFGSVSFGFAIPSRVDDVIAAGPHVSRSTVVLCIQRILFFPADSGLEAALGELPDPAGRGNSKDDAIAWVQNCACQKAEGSGLFL